MENGERDVKEVFVIFVSTGDSLFVLVAKTVLMVIFVGYDGDYL